MYEIDFTHPGKIHFIGIGGISMSGFAELLHSMGFTITGSDWHESKITKHLESLGIQVVYGQKEENITKDIDLVVYTAAVKKTNPEYQAAEKLNLPLMERAVMVGQVMKNYSSAIAIAGTHGKTTTTSIASHIFLAANLDPTISVGGILEAIGGNIRIGHSKHFITEACEYTNSFLHFFPTVGMILNIEEDHMDFFHDLSDIRHSFHLFAKRIPEHGTLIINADIENYEEIKRSLINSGYKFKTETDTEVACALIDNIYSEVKDITKTIEIFQKKVRGSYAIGLVCDDDYENLYAIKKNSPLIIAHGENENYIASDMPAILKFTKNFIALNDGDFAKISANDIKVFNKDGIEINKELKSFEGDLAAVCRQLEQDNTEIQALEKEIMEQPEVIKKTMNEYLTNNLDNLFKNMPDFSKYKKIHIVACGSAMHAGLVGKSLIEEYANVPVDVEIASEFRYKKLFLDENSLVIAVSQSGETADTLAAVEIAKKNNADTLGIINVVGSSIARESDLVLYTKAGSEIAVATTKAYSAQTALLSLIALNIGQKNISKAELKELLESIKKLPAQMEILLNKDKKYQEIAETIYNKEDIFFIGRDIDYAIAMEGSLKLKEISYIHSEAYPAGELKHGTISLIEEGTPVISIVTNKNIAEKTISNIKEVKSRGAEVILLTNSECDVDSDFYNKKIVIPTTHKLIQPLLTILPLQKISYEVAKLRGADIDQPKNLAKSVTVE